MTAGRLTEPRGTADLAARFIAGARRFWTDHNAAQAAGDYALAARYARSAAACIRQAALLTDNAAHDADNAQRNN